MKVRLGTIIVVAALTVQARSVDVTLWRGETTTRIVHDYARIGAAPDGFEVKVGTAHEVRYLTRPFGTHYERFADRVEWGSDAPGVKVLSVAVPEDAKPGEYWAGDVKITVIDRVLPPAKEWRYFLDLWQHPWAVARYFGVKPFSEEHYTKMRPLWKMLAETGQKTLTVTLLDKPWDNQCYDAYGTMIRHVRTKDGKWRFDYSVFDEYVEFGRECGLGPVISCYTMCPWGYMVAWEDEDGVAHNVKAVPGTDAFRDYWGDFLADFAAHLKDKGWFGDAVISIDERSPDDVRNIAALIAEKAPGLKIAIAGNRPPSQFEGIDIHHACFGLDHLTDRLISEAAERRKNGMVTTYYVCCEPDYPNTMCHNELEEAFWLGVYPAFAGLDGFLRWAWNSWPEDPMHDASYTGIMTGWKAGDTYLVYPDGSPSLRFLELKNGIVVAEKIRILKEQGLFTDDIAALAEKFDRKAALANKADFTSLKTDAVELVNKSEYATAMDVVAPRPVPRPALAARLAEGPEIIGIVHWGLNTFTDREWGFGDEDPAMLNPSKFDADQIVGACKAGGIGGLVVVAKHHDGFCLWPTKTTEHNITKTPFWRGTGNRGRGRDYVKEMEQACRRAGLKFGVYCSPWDRNNADYGTEKYVTDVFQQQLRELLSGDYGEIFEMWFDGANGGDGYYGGAREKRKIPDGYYRYDTETFAMVRKLQPNVCIFNEMDEADFRFCGNEQGLVDPDSRSTIGHYDGVWDHYKLVANVGATDGTTFHPIEADFPLRKGWFYHESERSTTKSAAYLTKLYLSSVGNAATMNIGIAPNKDGLLDADDVKALSGFKTLKDALFAHEVKQGESFNVVVMREDISKGEQVDEWEFIADGKAILRGKAIGVKRIRVLEAPCAAKSCEVRVLKNGGAFQGVSFKLYRADPELVRLVLSATTESGETDTAKWMTAASTAWVASAADMPSRVSVEGVADVALGEDGVVSVSSTGAVSFVRLSWPEKLSPEMLILNDAWERSYGDLEWQTLGEKTIYSPWYFLAEKDGKVQGFGVETGPGAMCCWEVSAKGVTLVLDVRAGGGPVRLNGRTLKACRIVRAESKAGESPWQFGRRFCRMMCPKPKMPKAPVYGYNDWYCAYGKNTATNFLADAAYIVSCAKDCANPPYVVMDDGWQKNSPPVVGESGRGPWDEAGDNFGMEMPEFCRRIAALGAKPGLWYRPLRAWDELPEEQRLIADRNYLDPTVPAVRSRIVEDVKRFRDWGFKLVKIDFLSYDLSQIWPCDPLTYRDRYIQDNRNWRNDSRTTAEVMLDIYKAMKDAAGDDVVIIGCNALNHLAAGVFELQRTGNDTSGKDWNWTRNHGVNTLAMRSIQDGAFFKIDADCVGLASEGAVPWNLNRQWMDLLGRSGTPFFISWRRELATSEVREALSKAFQHASSVRDAAEPLDWFVTRQPHRWRFADGASDFQWSND